MYACVCTSAKDAKGKREMAELAGCGQSVRDPFRVLFTLCLKAENPTNQDQGLCVLVCGIQQTGVCCPL